MKRIICKILLAICSVFSLVALFVPLLVVYEENKDDIAQYSIRNVFGSFPVKDINDVLIYGGTAIIKGSIVLLIVLQILAVLSLIWEKKKYMYAIYAAAAIANIISGVSIWLVAEENTNRLGWQIIKPGVGTYLMLAISIIEFILLMVCATVRKRV